MEATWKPHEKHGGLTERSDLPDSVFAFPKQRKEPLTDASHVRNAIAASIRRLGCPTRTASSPSPTSRRRRSITAWTCPSRTGRSSAASRARAARLRTAASRRRRRQKHGKNTSANTTSDRGKARHPTRIADGRTLRRSRGDGASASSYACSTSTWHRRADRLKRRCSRTGRARRELLRPLPWKPAAMTALPAAPGSSG